MTVKPLPVFQYALTKAPGTAAAQEFLSVFNPASSGRLMLALGLVIEPYAVGASSVDEPLILFRTSAASGGTLIDPVNITRFDPTFDPAPKAEVRIDNPTVTKTGLALLGVAPAFSTGTGATGSTFMPPPGVGAKIYPGTGITFGCAAGDTDQRWNIQFTWGEAS